MADDSQQTAVYRYYDRAGVLVYVGITGKGHGRATQHAAMAEWWPYVARQEIDHCTTRLLALERERDLIQRHRPPFNKQHNESYEDVRRAYLAMPEIVPCDDVVQAVRDRDKRVKLHPIGRDEKDRFFRFTSSPADFDLVRQLPLAESCKLIGPFAGKSGAVKQPEVWGPFVVFRTTLRPSADPYVGGAVARIRLVGQKPVRAEIGSIVVHHKNDGHSF